MAFEVIYIRTARSKGYITVGVESNGERRAYTVSEADYAAVGSPLTRDVLDGDTIKLLSVADEEYRARIFALRSLSLTDSSKKALANKLVAKGISFAVAAKVADEMEGLGYIKEDRMLLRLVAREANVNLSGPKKIMAKLISRGFSRGAIDSAMDALVASGEVDFTNSAKLLISKKLTRDATNDEIKKLLYKNGYTVC